MPAGMSPALLFTCTLLLLVANCASPEATTIIAGRLRRARRQREPQQQRQLKSLVSPPLGANVSRSKNDVPPVVVMHGIVGEAKKMRDIRNWIEEALPGTLTFAIEIGNGAVDSVVMPMTKQVDEFCKKIYEIEELRKGFNLIGFSQGGLIARAYVQRCNDFPVINLLSWNSPQGGQFGFSSSLVPDWLVRALNSAPYEPSLQDGVSVAQYWRDPYRLEEYLEKSKFLADLNNERVDKNPQYARNLVTLQTLMLQYSPNDGVISPEISGWFGTYARNTGPGKSGVLVPMQERELYTQDWIGLRQLGEDGRIEFHTANCSHAEVPTPSCKSAFDEFSLPILSRTWEEIAARHRNLLSRRPKYHAWYTANTTHTNTK